MELEQALKVVRAAGYRVLKPKPKKAWRVGPTCVVHFSDGEICRMTTHCDDDTLDFARGQQLCLAAWEIRVRNTWRRRLRAVSQLYPERWQAFVSRRSDWHARGLKAVRVYFERGGEVIGELQAA